MKLDCIILAAGAATRFGGNKLVADFHGQPLIARILNSVQALSPERIIVVSGAGHEQLRAQSVFQLNNLAPSVELHYCPQWQGGMGHSLAFGVRLSNNLNPIMILLGDQPRIGAQELYSLWYRWCTQPSHIVSSRFANTLGVPAIFPASFKPSLCECSGDRGAKPLLFTYAQQVLAVDIPAAEYDVDTQDDLKRELIAS